MKLTLGIKYEGVEACNDSMATFQIKLFDSLYLILISSSSSKLNSSSYSSIYSNLLFFRL